MNTRLFTTYVYRCALILLHRDLFSLFDTCISVFFVFVLRTILKHCILVAWESTQQDECIRSVLAGFFAMQGTFRIFSVLYAFVIVLIIFTIAPYELPGKYTRLNT